MTRYQDITFLATLQGYVGKGRVHYTVVPIEPDLCTASFMLPLNFAHLEAILKLSLLDASRRIARNCTVSHEHFGGRSTEQQITLIFKALI